MFVRKRYLEELIGLYQKKKKPLSVSDYKKEYLSKLKEENPFLYESDKFALELGTHHLGFGQRLSELLPGWLHSRGLYQNSSRTGMNNFLKVRNPHWIKLHEKPLRKFQKVLFRKKYDWNIHTGAKN